MKGFAGYCRNLLVFPRGSNREAMNRAISVFLNVPDGDTPPGWERRTFFTLKLLNQDESKHISKCGFPHYLPTQCTLVLVAASRSDMETP